MENSIKCLIELAKSEVGYLEKKSNSKLDDKTANAGHNNWTKYTRDLDAIPNFYNGKKNGIAAWCDIFVDWLFVKTYGVEEAKRMLNQPNKSCGAGCGYSANYFKQIGRFYKTNPKAGDQIFFYGSDMKSIAHTGIVIAVGTDKVYTIEGNTSSASGVVDNGGCVREKSYSLNYSRIYGYGRPLYPTVITKNVYSLSIENVEDEAFLASVRELCESKGYTLIEDKTVVEVSVPTETPTPDPEYAPTVLEWQEAAIADGFKFPKWGADGKWGSECESVATNAIIKDNRPKYLYPNLTKMVQGIVGAGVDGLCGPATTTKIKEYQQLNGLVAEGMWGPACWKYVLDK